MGRRKKRFVTLEERDENVRRRLEVVAALQASFPSLDTALIAHVADECGLDADAAVLHLSGMSAGAGPAPGGADDAKAAEAAGAAGPAPEELLADMFGLRSEEAARALRDADGDLDAAVDDCLVQSHLRGLSEAVDAWYDEEPEPEPDAGATAAPAPGPGAPWACARCTYENEPAAFGCVMCGVGREPRTPSPPPARPAKLSELMDAEMARQLGAEELLDAHVAGLPRAPGAAAAGMPFGAPCAWTSAGGRERAFAPDLGSRMKLERLRRRLPFVSESVLLATFASVGRDYGLTLAAFGAEDAHAEDGQKPLLGVMRPRRAERRVRGNIVERADDAAAAAAARSSSSSSASRPGADMLPDESELLSAGRAEPDDGIYVEARRGVDHHLRRRDELLRQSRRAASSGNRAYAGQLAQKAREEARLAQEANVGAVRRIFAAKNRGHAAGTVDLHGLRVGEALHIVDELLARNAGRGRRLRFVVGVGRGSAGGLGVLGPAVTQFLRRRGYNPSDGTPGVVRVRV